MTVMNPTAVQGKRKTVGFGNLLQMHAALAATEGSAELAVSEARRSHMALLERGLQYVKAGDFGSAEAYYADALARASEELSDGHRDVVNITRTLANVCTQQGKHAEAEPLHRRVLAAMEREHGDGHIMTASALASLAQALRGMGRGEEAAPLADRAAKVMERGLPDELATSSSGEDEDDSEEEEEEEEGEEGDEEVPQAAAEAKEGGASGKGLDAGSKGDKTACEGWEEERQPLAERKEQEQDGPEFKPAPFKH